MTRDLFSECLLLFFNVTTIPVNAQRDTLRKNRTFPLRLDGITLIIFIPFSSNFSGYNRPRVSMIVAGYHDSITATGIIELDEIRLF